MHTFQLLISQDEIKQRIEEIAPIIDAEYAGDELVIVMVMKGAFCVTADLIRLLKTPCTLEYIQASSYGLGGTKKGELKIVGLENLNLTSKNVLLIDDICDSGNTLTELIVKLQQKRPKSLKTLVLLTKNVPRDPVYNPDYTLFEIENLFVIGYGLDYKEYYRGLPGIYLYEMESK